MRGFCRDCIRDTGHCPAYGDQRRRTNQKIQHGPLSVRADDRRPHDRGSRYRQGFPNRAVNPFHADAPAYVGADRADPLPVSAAAPGLPGFAEEPGITSRARDQQPDLVHGWIGCVRRAWRATGCLSIAGAGDRCVAAFVVGHRVAHAGGAWPCPCDGRQRS